MLVSWTHVRRCGDATPRRPRGTRRRAIAGSTSRARCSAYRDKFIATGKFAPLKHFMVRARASAREGSVATRTFERARARDDDDEDATTDATTARGLTEERARDRWACSRWRSGWRRIIITSTTGSTVTATRPPRRRRRGGGERDGGEQREGTRGAGKLGRGADGGGGIAGEGEGDAGDYDGAVRRTSATRGDAIPSRSRFLFW